MAKSKLDKKLSQQKDRGIPGWLVVVNVVWLFVLAVCIISNIANPEGSAIELQAGILFWLMTVILVPLDIIWGIVYFVKSNS